MNIQKPLRGFTLIELLVASAILAVLTAVSISHFGVFSANRELNRAAEQFMTDLRAVQNRALSAVDREFEGEDYHWWGIEFESGSPEYRVCQSSSGAPPLVCDRLARTKSLPSGFDFAVGGAVWFKMVTGEVEGAGTITVRRTGVDCAASPDGCRDVIVSAGGRIE